MHAPIHNSFKGNRVPENNSNQGGGGKLSTVKSFNFLKKEIEKDTKNEKTAHGHGLQNSNCENDHYVKSNLQIQCNPDKKFQSHSSQKYLKKNILKFIWNYKRHGLVKAILSKRTVLERLPSPDVKIYYRGIAIKTVRGWL